MIRNVIIPSRLFEDYAIKFCSKINSEFNLNRDIDKEFSITNPSSKILKSVVGTYVNKKNDTLFFEERGNQLYESTYDKKNFQYNSQRRFIDGNLRYLNDNLFYRNRVENIKLNADGSVSLINIFYNKPISLRRISK
ncbi:hypothetical protein [Polaribacter glomeratus]|uniref:Uncharacterized protein n=1 Tax=Polaribacter glomeratus TaxID=102 RepID=A0A2S7WWR2_9FLAO|nr:hypothetical protein [Polaribacter glomeratus]PQJ82008.1 hypothetical protein BTO16_05220 [Polaribacter glomeratus]TXD66601.1 hypothetical protein ESX12_03530 [Polaribacter glomeratus]